MIEARLHPRIDAIPAADWDALHDGRNPFVCHAFLAALERTGCLRSDWGWSAHHLTLHAGDALIAAAPMYLKANSHGEFVFDHAWAHAYAEHGLDYFPKWLCAVPYSPVTGPRLLAASASMRALLATAMVELCARQGLSSVHVNFHAEMDDADFAAGISGPNVAAPSAMARTSAATSAHDADIDASTDSDSAPASDVDSVNIDNPWLLREDVQYHWRNAAGWGDFDAFLAAMDHKHRKNIRAERRKVREAGVRFRHLHGDEATEADLDAIHGFYLQTFAEYGNSPALTRAFFGEIARSMPRNVLLILAEMDGQPIAGAFCLRGGDTLYGRYWGSHLQLPGLHFETCYYQGIEYCLQHGLTRFEPGAQGEHKLARGFLPEIVRSRHWIADARFGDALADWCAEEVASVRRYAQHACAHSPFKRDETLHDE